ncbi:MAG: hypothetical protein H6502_02970 [Candidatus Woesearchaeota archaeon]|nr:MAG: hypothetical protein H6502_02970 [Candidatus Woesearchaeota archaeon]
MAPLNSADNKLQPAELFGKKELSKLTKRFVLVVLLSMVSIVIFASFFIFNLPRNNSPWAFVLFLLVISIIWIIRSIVFGIFIRMVKFIHDQFSPK